MSSSSASPSAEPHLVVLIGPGGTGKGTIAAKLVELDDRLWLSRSWTTRAPRDGEHPEAYVFVDRDRFVAHERSGGFLEWAEFLGNLYGTPVPEAPPGSDVLLEIELEGARQVLEARPDATVILLVPPSEEVQEARLEGAATATTTWPAGWPRAARSWPREGCSRTTRWSTMTLRRRSTRSSVY